MTDAEILLWARVRKHQIAGFPFCRQKIIGRYIVDFYCPRAKLVIEVDGGQHYSDDYEEKDRIRDNYMAGQGLCVLRFTDTDVLTNIEGVLESILQHMGLIDDKTPFSPLFDKLRAGSLQRGRS